MTTTLYCSCGKKLRDEPVDLAEGVVDPCESCLKGRYDAGYDEGKFVGYDEGRMDGYDEGHSDGVEEGGEEP
jgi:hypothetical protein